MAIIPANQVTRMGMAGGMWQPHGSYAGKIPPVVPPTTSRGSGSSGRSFTWTPDIVHEKDSTRKFTKTALDRELEKLLKEAIRREDLQKSAQEIADRLEDDVNAVSILRLAAHHVERELLTLQWSKKIQQEETNKRLRKLKEEEDIIMSILLSEV